MFSATPGARVVPHREGTRSGSSSRPTPRAREIARRHYHDAPVARPGRRPYRPAHLGEPQDLGHPLARPDVRHFDPVTRAQPNHAVTSSERPVHTVSSFRVRLMSGILPYWKARGRLDAARGRPYSQPRSLTTERTILCPSTTSDSPARRTTWRGGSRSGRPTWRSSWAFATTGASSPAGPSPTAAPRTSLPGRRPGCPRRAPRRQRVLRPKLFARTTPGLHRLLLPLAPLPAMPALNVTLVEAASATGLGSATLATLTSPCRLWRRFADDTAMAAVRSSTTAEASMAGQARAFTGALTARAWSQTSRPFPLLALQALGGLARRSTLERPKMGAPPTP